MRSLVAAPRHPRAERIWILVSVVAASLALNGSADAKPKPKRAGAKVAPMKGRTSPPSGVSAAAKKMHPPPLTAASPPAPAAAAAPAPAPEDPGRVVLAAPLADGAVDRPLAAPPSAAERAADSRRLGVLVGVGFPRPLSIEAVVKPTSRAALSGELAFLPTVTVMGVAANQIALAGSLRIFPTRGPLFVGLRGGFQRLTLTREVALPAGGSLAAKAVAETMFINPRVGLLWTSASGLTVGVDAGVHIPIGASMSSSLPAAASSDDMKPVTRVADALGNQVTPTVDLLRIGMLF